MAVRSPTPRRTGGDAPERIARRGRPSTEHLRQRFASNLSRLLDEQRDLPRGTAARASLLADVCGVTPAAARKWLTGAGWPTLEKLLVLAQRYGFAPEHLLFTPAPRAIPGAEAGVGLGGLVPLLELDRPYAPPPLAIDPRRLAGREPGAETAPESAFVLVRASDDAMAPWCLRDDLLVVSTAPVVDPSGPLAFRLTAGGPVVLRWISRTPEGFRLDALCATAGIVPLRVPALARGALEASAGSPQVVGRPCWLLRGLTIPLR